MPWFQLKNGEWAYDNPEGCVICNRPRAVGTVDGDQACRVCVETYGADAPRKDKKKK